MKDERQRNQVNPSASIRAFACDHRPRWITLFPMSTFDLAAIFKSIRLPEIVAALNEHLNRVSSARLRFYDEMFDDQKQEFLDGSTIRLASDTVLSPKTINARRNTEFRLICFPTGENIES